MPFNPGAEAAYRAGSISFFELGRLSQNPSVLTGGNPPPVVPGTDVTSRNAQAGERARLAMGTFLVTHRAMPPAVPGGSMRWLDLASGAVLPCEAAPPI